MFFNIWVMQIFFVVIFLQIIQFRPFVFDHLHSVFNDVVAEFLSDSLKIVFQSQIQFINIL